MCFDLVYLFLSASLPSISFGLPIGPPLIFLCLFLCLGDLMNLVTAFFPELWTFALYHRRSLTLPQPPPPADRFSRRGEVSRVPPCSIVDCWCDAVLRKSCADNPSCASLCVQVPHSTTSHPFPFVKFIFLNMCCFVNVWAPLACSASGDQKRASALLGLELQIRLGVVMWAREMNVGPWKSSRRSQPPSLLFSPWLLYSFCSLSVMFPELWGLV